MSEKQSTTVRSVRRGDYSINVVDCVTGLGLYAGLVFVHKRGERPAMLASCRALTIPNAFARATKWLDDWTRGEYRVDQPIYIVGGVADA